MTNKCFIAKCIAPVAWHYGELELCAKHAEVFNQDAKAQAETLANNEKFRDDLGLMRVLGDVAEVTCKP